MFIVCAVRCVQCVCQQAVEISRLPEPLHTSLRQDVDSCGGAEYSLKNNLPHETTVVLPDVSFICQNFWDIESLLCLYHDAPLKQQQKEKKERRKNQKFGYVREPTTHVTLMVNRNMIKIHA